jgi:hypothetical protein
LDVAHRVVVPSLAVLVHFLWAHTSFVYQMYDFDDYDTFSRQLDNGVLR